MSYKLILEHVDFSLLPKDSYVIEIGSVRDKDSGKHSTEILYEESIKNGLNFLSVDFSKDAVDLAKSYIPEDKAILANGAEFLKGFNEPISVLYLDNFEYATNKKHLNRLNLEFGDSYGRNNEKISNKRSSKVHLEQMKEAFSKLTKPCFVCVDDTYNCFNAKRNLIEKLLHIIDRLLGRDTRFIGKGAYVVPFLQENGYHIVKIGMKGVLLTNE